MLLEYPIVWSHCKVIIGVLISVLNLNTDKDCRISVSVPPFIGRFFPSVLFMFLNIGIINRISSTRTIIEVKLYYYHGQIIKKKSDKTLLLLLLKMYNNHRGLLLHICISNLKIRIVFKTALRYFSCEWINSPKIRTAGDYFEEIFRGSKMLQPVARYSRSGKKVVYCCFFFFKCIQKK